MLKIEYSLKNFWENHKKKGRLRSRLPFYFICTSPAMTFDAYPVPAAIIKIEVIYFRAKFSPRNFAMTSPLVRELY